MGDLYVSTHREKVMTVCQFLSPAFNTLASSISCLLEHVLYNASYHVTDYDEATVLVGIM